MGFEAEADEVVNVPDVPLLAICQYRLGELDPRTLWASSNATPSPWWAAVLS